MTRIVSLDFETWPVGKTRPDIPGKPIGVAFQYDGRPSAYESWGHVSGNTMAEDLARMTVRDIFDAARRGACEIVFHNAKYDLSVAYEKLGLDELPWHCWHDTMFLSYLADPHARRIGLKELCEDLLDWPKEEKDAIQELVWERRFDLRKAYPEHLTKWKLGSKGHAIRWLPMLDAGDVEPYAKGDAERTLALFKHLHPLILENGMGEAYDRERQLLPILMENERDGMRVDTEALAADIDYYGDVLGFVERWLRKRLSDSALNFNADAQVSAAFSREGIVDDADWSFTDSGLKWLKKHPGTPPEDVPPEYRSVSKDNLPPSKFKDAQVAQAFGYRNRLVTCLNTFMKPWLEQAKKRGGVISTSWNQTRGGDGGTRTGRPSTSQPNFLNLSKTFEGRSDGYEHPEFLKIEKLPQVRRYILADEGHVFLHRDFSGQEVRMFANYEQGDLLRAYRANPALDPHGWVKQLIEDVVGLVLERTRVKNVTFSRLYGGGTGAVFEQARCTDMAEAKKLVAAHDKALPGRKGLVDEITKMSRRGEPIVTWGGRLYFVEPPMWVKGRMMNFEYKLINYLIQGSSADLTKECLIRWYNHPQRDPRTRFLVTVYDEINITCPADCWQEQMLVLKACMEDVDLDCPMVTEGKVGPAWGELRICVAPGGYVEASCAGCGSRHVVYDGAGEGHCHQCGVVYYGDLRDKVLCMDRDNLA